MEEKAVLQFNLSVCLLLFFISPARLLLGLNSNTLFRPVRMDRQL